jgi:hypothetical protein
MMSRKRRLIRGLTSCVAAVLLLVGSAAASDGGIEDLHGRWVDSGDDSERQRRLDAIEATVQQLSWVARGIARKRLTASTRIHDWYELRVDEDTVTIVEEAGNRFSTRWDGVPLNVPKNLGGPATLTRTWRDGALHSHWFESKGEGTESYRLSENGQTMHVTMVIASKRLPSEVRYELTYRRAPEP